MKTVLVAVDQTEEAASVLAHALDLARSMGATLTLLHVVDVPRELPPPGSVLMRLPASGQELVDAARRHLALLAEEVPHALRGEVLVETGHPASVICEIAKSRNADLVVIGAHRHGMVGRAIGTTAARVVNHLDRAVVVIRGRDPGAFDRDRFPSLRSVIAWSDAQSESVRVEAPPRTAIDIDLAAILYTADAAEDAKGVMLTHRSMSSAASSVAEYRSITASTR